MWDASPTLAATLAYVWANSVWCCWFASVIFLTMLNVVLLISMASLAVVLACSAYVVDFRIPSMVLWTKASVLFRSVWVLSIARAVVSAAVFVSACAARTASWTWSMSGILASLARRVKVPIRAALLARGSRGCPFLSFAACSRWLAGQSGAGGHGVAIMPVLRWAMQLALGNPIDPAGGCLAATKG
ncbi:hypothetical protein B0I35DRAFT_440900 [Stachybotrys elegans]|uniref:Uncharacterized protein n=1 Tax=Stachybotrys elegans TaxID=80388 RepID=A0A8K0SI76_9HYPO|nr:hypothetical protein B0I35DRAFT_440900 [Stachybotrys elegans]